MATSAGEPHRHKSPSRHFIPVRRLMSLSPCDSNSLIKCRAKIADMQSLSVHRLPVSVCRWPVHLFTTCAGICASSFLPFLIPTHEEEEERHEDEHGMAIKKQAS